MRGREGVLGRQVHSRGVGAVVAAVCCTGLILGPRSANAPPNAPAEVPHQRVHQAAGGAAAVCDPAHHGPRAGGEPLPCLPAAPCLLRLELAAGCEASRKRAAERRGRSAAGGAVAEEQARLLTHARACCPPPPDVAARWQSPLATSRAGCTTTGRCEPASLCRPAGSSALPLACPKAAAVQRGRCSCCWRAAGSSGRRRCCGQPGAAWFNHRPPHHGVTAQAVSKDERRSAPIFAVMDAPGKKIQVGRRRVHRPHRAGLARWPAGSLAWRAQLPPTLT